jgi:hypothetical protein
VYPEPEVICGMTIFCDFEPTVARSVVTVYVGVPEKFWYTADQLVATVEPFSKLGLWVVAQAAPEGPNGVCTVQAQFQPVGQFWARAAEFQLIVRLSASATPMRAAPPEGILAFDIGTALLLQRDDVRRISRIGDAHSTSVTAFERHCSVTVTRSTGEHASFRYAKLK